MKLYSLVVLAAAIGCTGSTDPAGGSGAAWSPLSVMAVVNPKDYGAVGDGVADDLTALAATIDALPAAGGIVYLPEGASFKKTNLLVVTKAHVKFWAPNRQAELFQSIAGQRRHVRRAPSDAGFQQRFEYVFKGAPDAVTAFVITQTAVGAVLSEERTVGAVAYALLLTPAPVALAGALTPVTFRDLRAGDMAGDLSWLWQRVDTGAY